MSLTALLNEGSDAIYSWPLARDAQGNSAVIIYFNNARFKITWEVDASTRSTLQRSIISLERYGKPQLVDILSQRVGMAFEPGQWKKMLLTYCRVAFAETGNARFGIELMCGLENTQMHKSQKGLSPNAFAWQYQTSFRYSRSELAGLDYMKNVFACGRLTLRKMKSIRFIVWSEKTYA